MITSKMLVEFVACVISGMLGALIAVGVSEVLTVWREYRSLSRRLKARHRTNHPDMV